MQSHISRFLQLLFPKISHLKCTIDKTHLVEEIAGKTYASQTYPTKSRLQNKTRDIPGILALFTEHFLLYTNYVAIQTCFGPYQQVDVIFLTLSPISVQWFFFILLNMVSLNFCNCWLDHRILEQTSEQTVRWQTVRCQDEDQLLNSEQMFCQPASWNRPLHDRLFHSHLCLYPSSKLIQLNCFSIASRSDTRP